MAIGFYKVKGPYGCFSNFSKHSFVLEDKYWGTSEIYFQAKKFEGTEYEERIRNMKNSLAAANMGRRRDLPLRKDWEDVKVEIMRRAVYAKFSQNIEIQNILLSTDDEELVEETCIDYYWGCGKDGTGKNMLGKVLMETRDRLRKELK